MIWPILVAIVAFGIIVFIHELGHFLFAKLFKIRVNEFAVGFGPAIIKFQKGETLYALRIIPFGGYCAMEGESEDSTDERAFFRAKVWQRIVVTAAGAVFNIILGFLIMWSIVGIDAYRQGDNLVGTPRVAKFKENATSNKNNGLKEKDLILAMNGVKIYSQEDINYVLQTDDNAKIDIKVNRDNKVVELKDVEFTRAEFEGQKYVLDDIIYKGEKNTFFVSIKQAYLRTISMARMVWMSLGDLIRGKYSITDLSGPVGVTQVLSEAVVTVNDYGLGGFAYLLKILCLITINLGIFNLFPIPALDGSRILFLIIEGIRKKPVKNEAMVHTVGLVILMAFMVLIVFKDLWTWIF